MHFKNINKLETIRKARTAAVYPFNFNSDKHILFIHGAGGRADQWECQIDYFKDNYQITTFDLIGHGRSPKPRNGYDFKEMLLDVVAIFDKYKRHENIIIAHSYGVALGLHMALLKQTEIQKLVLIGANVPRLTAGVEIWNLPVFILEWMRPIFSRGFVKRAFHPETSSELINREQAVSDTNPMAVMKGLIKGMKEMPPIQLENNSIPTLIINGDTDGLTPVEGAGELLNLLPNSKLEVVSKASHFVMMEQPQIVNEIISKFLNGNKDA